MSERRKREPFATVNLPDLPAWGRARYRARVAHRFRRMATLHTPRFTPVCGAGGWYTGFDLEQPHPDDRRCKHCLARERKEAPDE